MLHTHIHIYMSHSLMLREDLSTPKIMLLICAHIVQLCAQREEFALAKMTPNNVCPPNFTHTDVAHRKKQFRGVHRMLRTPQIVFCAPKKSLAHRKKDTFLGGPTYAQDTPGRPRQEGPQSPGTKRISCAQKVSFTHPPNNVFRDRRTLRTSWVPRRVPGPPKNCLHKKKRLTHPKNVSGGQRTQDTPGRPRGSPQAPKTCGAQKKMNAPRKKSSGDQRMLRPFTRRKKGFQRVMLGVDMNVKIWGKMSWIGLVLGIGGVRLGAWEFPNPPRQHRKKICERVYHACVSIKSVLSRGLPDPPLRTNLGAQVCP